MFHPDDDVSLGSVNKPAKILVVALNRLLGDFTNILIVANSIADRFDHRIVSVMFQPDWSFKRDLVRLLPDAGTIECRPDIPLPSFDLINPNARSISGKFAETFQSWFDKGMQGQDIVVTSRMGEMNFTQTIDRVSPLRFSSEDARICADKLIAMGLFPDRWFCTLHGREPGFVERNPALRVIRDALPGSFQNLAMHIITQLGGQVVRLGHPGMSAFPAMEGIVDLSGIPDSILLQAFAISRSRFFFGSPSGPTAVADAFLVPEAQIDCVHYTSYNHNCVRRTVDLVTPDGRILRQKELFDVGFHEKRIVAALLGNNGFKVIKTSPDEMVRFADFMYEMTSDCKGWREPAQAPSGPKPNQFSWPLGPSNPRGQFLPVP